VISGLPVLGQTLQVTSPGIWVGFPDPLFTYQWRRGGTDIAGATGPSYLLVLADVGQNISCRVTGTNAAGTGTALTAAIGPIVEAVVAPANTVLPAITGTPQVGQTLTVSNGTWTGNPAPTFARQWQADGADIPGATASTYVLQPGDLGKLIRTRVTATNSGGSAQATSAAVGPVTSASLPVVAMASLDATVNEGENLGGTLSISPAFGATTNVTIAITGVGADPAEIPADMQASLVVAVPAAATSHPFSVLAVDDALEEPAEGVRLTIQPDAAYTVGSPAFREAEISASDTGGPTVTPLAATSVSSEGFWVQMSGTAPTNAELDPDVVATPYGLRVQRAGFLTTGSWSASAFEEWVLGTIRKPTVESPYDLNTFYTDRVSLAEEIYIDDALVGVSSGVTNNSLTRAPKQCCRCVSLYGQWVKAGTIIVEFVATSTHAMNGEPLAALRVILDRGTANEQVQVISATVLKASILTPYPAAVYRATFDVSALPDGHWGTIDYEALPWIGRDNADYDLSSVRKSWLETDYDQGATWRYYKDSRPPIHAYVSSVSGFSNFAGGARVSTDETTARDAAWSSTNNLYDYIRNVANVPELGGRCTGPIIFHPKSDDANVSVFPSTSDTARFAGNAPIYIEKDNIAFPSALMPRNFATTNPRLGPMPVGDMDNIVLFSGFDFTRSANGGFSSYTTWTNNRCFIGFEGCDMRISTSVATQNPSSGIVCYGQVNRMTVHASNGTSTQNVFADASGTQTMRWCMFHDFDMVNVVAGSRGEMKDGGIVSARLRGIRMRRTSATNDGRGQRNGVASSVAWLNPVPGHEMIFGTTLGGDSTLGKRWASYVMLNCHAMIGANADHMSTWSKDGAWTELENCGEVHCTVWGIDETRTGVCYNDKDVGAPDASLQRRLQRRFVRQWGFCGQESYKAMRFVAVNQGDATEAPFRTGSERFRVSVGWECTISGQDPLFPREYYGQNRRQPPQGAVSGYALLDNPVNPRFEDYQGVTYVDPNYVLGNGEGSVRLLANSPGRVIPINPWRFKHRAKWGMFGQVRQAPSATTWPLIGADERPAP
jgi:hypothetical protein